MSGSSALEEEASPELEGPPLLEVEGVSKEYAPLGSQRVQRLFSRLGGIVPDDPFFDDSGGDDDDDDDDDDLADDEVSSAEVGRASALTDISFTCRGGSCVALCGPAGSGKSTLLKVAAGVIPPSRGYVRIHGSVAPALDSVVSLFPKGSTVERGLPVLAGMLRVRPAEVRRRLPEILEVFGAPDQLRRDPTRLPGRRRRELLLAMALTLDASVVLIDVPLPSGQDGVRYLERVVAAKSRGALVVITSRSSKRVPDVVDRILELRDGRLVADRPRQAAESDGWDADGAWGEPDGDA